MVNTTPTQSITAGSGMRKLISTQVFSSPGWTKLLLYRRDGTPFWALVYACPLWPCPLPRPAADGKQPAAGGSSGSGSGGASSNAAAAAGGGGGTPSDPGGGAAGGVGAGGNLQLLLLMDVTSQRLRRLGKYMVGKVVGQGASGVVRMGKNPTTGELWRVGMCAWVGVGSGESKAAVLHAAALSQLHCELLPSQTSWWPSRLSTPPASSPSPK
jgi:hypothetical protein